MLKRGLQILSIPDVEGLVHRIEVKLSIRPTPTPHLPSDVCKHLHVHASMYTRTHARASIPSQSCVDHARKHGFVPEQLVPSLACMHRHAGTQAHRPTETETRTHWHTGAQACARMCTYSRTYTDSRTRRSVEVSVHAWKSTRWCHRSANPDA